MLAQIPRFASNWGPGTNSAESRAFLQERLALFAMVICGIFSAALVVASIGVFFVIDVENGGLATAIAGAVAAVLGGIWLVLSRCGPRSLATLHFIDAATAIMLGLDFGIGAYLLSSLPETFPGGILFLSFAVFGRALIVPSTARRTCILSIATMAPLALVGIWIAIQVPTANHWPPALLMAGPVLTSCAAIFLATIGSAVIYGLRQEVRKAQQLGQYTLGEKIGEGGMGAVYKARHAMLRRPTAIKLLRPDRAGKDGLDRFEREVQLTSELTHPNTIAIYDYGRSPEGVFYYAMEYLDGIDLERLVRRHGAQPVPRVLHILRQVCSALAEAHSHGLVHRDIKPANIILCHRGLLPDVVKVVDFGLAKALKDDLSDDEHKATPGTITGTPAYLPPEAIAAPQSVGPASDLYAVGAVGYYLLTGQTVFTGETVAELCVHHLESTPVAPSQRVQEHSDGRSQGRISPELDALLLQCLAKNPAERPASAQALCEAVERLLADLGGWSTSQAQAWWRMFEEQRTLDTSMAVAPTLSLTVDLSRRAALD